MVYLQDNLSVRSRQVYNLIEFISEISGFADIFFLAAGFFFGQFYQPRMQTAHMTRSLIEVQGRRKRRLPQPELDVALTLQARFRPQFNFCALLLP